MMNPIRLGIIGLGNMGQAHARLVQDIGDIDLAAVCDIDPVRLNMVVEQYGCKGFADPAALMRAKCCDAVLIATPHYDHTTLGIAALRNKLHLLVEKPVSVHKADCEKLLRAHTDSNLVFAAMFNQRTNPQYQRIREMIANGDLGAIHRINWTITDWFRSQAYYDSGGWRATWRGEGGGVLMNQCPHQLDLLQWLFGMPTRLRAFCHLGKHHHIEVEDDVTCYLEWPNGATGVFTTTTGEAPGVNRLEIAAENGLLVHDLASASIHYRENEKSISRAITENQAFRKPATTEREFRFENEGPQHAGVLANFAGAILRGESLIAPAAEGIHSVELANAMLFSALTDRTLTLPLNGRSYARRLRKLAADSTFHKPEAVASAAVDMKESF